MYIKSEYSDLLHLLQIVLFDWLKVILRYVTHDCESTAAFEFQYWSLITLIGSKYLHIHAILTFYIN